VVERRRAEAREVLENMVADVVVLSVCWWWPLMGGDFELLIARR
jgi:hypothetical protein